MPDAAAYLKAISIAAGASALVVLALGGVRRPAGAARWNAACILGIALGLASGGASLQLPLSLPPASALARLFEIVLPAAMGIELLAAFERAPRWLAWGLRLILAASAGRILLHGSVYLAGLKGEWTAWQASIYLALCGAALAMVWGLLSWLAERSPGISIPLALSQASLAGGAAVMLAGYLAGGEAALSLAAALAGAAIAASFVGPRLAPQGLIGLGVIGLFGILFIGRFFGRLSTGAALAVLFAPLLCWATEAPLLVNRKPWLKGAIRLALAAIPLAFVLAAAKLEFDRGMRPLLGVDRPLHP
ncbi:MAG TPA: hypothetical protein VMV10_15690 [Pirellulales bacterium]|nr:hypothetical protein [Pirellulales bacterium]